MVPRTSYPPTHHHASLTTHLSPSAAQTHLAAFLDKTSTQPHLHPDSLLSITGVTYSAHSGPSGGLALHHLRRIEAGLRGEELGAETEDDLNRLNGDGDEGEGDDTILDTTIARTERKLQDKQSKKRKRTAEIQDWAEDASSQADFATGREIESFAHTPLHQSEGDGAAEGAGQDEWQDQREWELQQRPLEGELGEREGAPVQRQNGVRPRVVEYGGGDGGGGKGGPLTKAEKDARKKAKKARRMEEKGRD